MIYLINPAGSVKNVEAYQMESLKKKGWRELPQSEIGENGKPKQVYYPQFDGGTKEAGDIERPGIFQPIKEILEVEVF